MAVARSRTRERRVAVAAAKFAVARTEARAFVNLAEHKRDDSLSATGGCVDDADCYAIANRGAIRRPTPPCDER